LESEFARAVANNDADALDGILADDWIIVDPDGSIIDKRAFSESSNPVFCPMSRWNPPT
jgi:ketosteroid isomerase-like protein